MKNRIKQVRLMVELTQSEFGARIGVKRNTVAGYETGVRTPSDVVLKSISREFGVREEWLKTGDGPMLSDEKESSIISKSLSYPLSDSDMEIVKMFAGLNSSQRAAVMSFMKTLSEYDSQPGRTISKQESKLGVDAILAASDSAKAAIASVNQASKNISAIQEAARMSESVAASVLNHNQNTEKK